MGRGQGSPNTSAKSNAGKILTAGKSLDSHAKFGLIFSQYIVFDGKVNLFNHLSISFF